MGKAQPRPLSDLDGPPVVGEAYLVPHVFMTYLAFGRQEPRWWPVIGPAHDDAEHLNFAPKHYHIDQRFLPARMLREHLRDRRPGGRSGYSRAKSTEFQAQPLMHPVHSSDPLPQPELRRAVCIVADAGFLGLSDGHKNFIRLHEAYEGKRCGRDADGRLVCPHKGAPLHHLASDRDGLVLCPLHGLLIDTRAGVVVKRARLPRVVT